MVLNPTLALQTWVWSFLSYNQKLLNEDNQMVTKFSLDHMARYAWIYVLAPCMAGIIGGMLAKTHMKYLSSVQKEGKE